MQNQPFLYCGGMELNPAILLSCTGTSNPITDFYRKNTLQYTSMGRIAIDAACERFGLTACDEVLVPAYNCGSEIDPIIGWGAKTVMYRINPDVSINADDLFARVTSRTKVIFVIHYFGFPQNLDNIREYCRVNKIYLWEDCAHSLFSKTSNGVPLGSESNAAFFSLPKSLPLPDGGILMLNDAAGDNHQTVSLLRKPGTARVIRRTLPYFKSFVLNRMGKYSSLSRPVPPLPRASPLDTAGEPSVPVTPPDIPSNYYFDPSLRSTRLSSLSARILRTIRPDDVIHKRQSNFRMLLNGFRDVPWVTPVMKELPDGVCPLYFPLIVDSRDNFLAYLAVRGINALPFWKGFNRKIDYSPFRDEIFLKDHLACLQVHQHLQPRHLEHMIVSVRNYHS